MFRYIEKNLGKEEKILAKSHIHWLEKWKLFGLFFIAKRRHEISLTNKRFVYRYGLFVEKVDQLSIGKIESINVVQGPLAKMFGYGKLVVTGSGGHFMEINYVKNPNIFRSSFNDI